MSISSKKPLVPPAVQPPVVAAPVIARPAGTTVGSLNQTSSPARPLSRPSPKTVSFAPAGTSRFVVQLAFRIDSQYLSTGN